MEPRKEKIKGVGEVLFEFSTHGNYVKVSAVDPITNTEISIIGDRRSGKKTLENMAVKKLLYVIKKQTKEKQKNQIDDNLY